MSLIRSSGAALRAPVLDGFVDTVLQSFENCRPGLPDDATLRVPGQVEAFFREIYEREMPRLLDTISEEEPHLSPEARAEYARSIDALFRKVVLPAYARVASRFTAKERNDFYRLPDSLHALERLLWMLGGFALGAFVIWSPIPLWDKWWLLPFTLGGLFVPETRRWLALRGYEKELNALVTRAEDEIRRLDMAYLTSPDALSARAAARAAQDASGMKQA